MISHVTIGVRNFEISLNFYTTVMDELSYKRKFCDLAIPWAGWQKKENNRPLFIIATPINGDEQSAGNGQMIALLASSRQKVDSTYEIALRLGGKCCGRPGLRPEYHANYYGAYFKDLDSNKLCVVCH